MRGVKQPLRDSRLTAINFVADAVNRPLALEEIADNALHAILSVMKLDAGALYIPSATAGALALLAARAVPPPPPHVTDGTELERQLTTAGFATVLVTQVDAGDGKALLAVANRAVRPFSEGDLELVEVMSNQIGHAMKHAQLQASLREKNKLLKLLIEEAHHRIKNNLQMISGLLQLQLDGTREPTAVDLLRTAVTRIQAIAQVHNLLSAAMPEKVDVRQLIEAVVNSVVSTAPTRLRDAPRVDLKLAALWSEADQAVALALIVNELVANSLLHGRPANGHTLHVTISCGQDGHEGVVEVCDNGGGLPTSPTTVGGQGMNIVRQLARVNLRGVLTVTNRDQGVCGKVRFPVVTTGSAAVGPLPQPAS